MYFELRYITADFGFEKEEIAVSAPEKKIDVLLRKRVPEDEPLSSIEARDGFAMVTCERDVADRLQQEAASTGRLSIKKAAVRQVNDEMRDYMLRTLRLIRWKTNCPGGPNPIRSGIQNGFRWSLDGKEWKPVADCLSVTINFTINPQWKSEDALFVKTEVSSELDEPLAHELLREASTNCVANPRSAVVLGVAAAEVGFKHFAAKVLPDAAWLLEMVQSPPLVKMLAELFPWSKLGMEINGKSVTPPDSVIATLKKAVVLRNEIVHGGRKTLDGRTVTSVLTAVRDLLYFLDAVQGQQWALNHLSAEATKHFTPVTS